MSVDFIDENNDQFVTSHLPQIMEAEMAGIIGFLIKKGIVKTKAQANMLLVGIIILLLIMAIVVLFFNLRPVSKIVAPPGRQVEYPKNAPPRLKTL